MISKRYLLFCLMIVVLGSSSQLYARSLGILNASDFGLPEKIGEYRVLAVETPDTIACMKSGVKRLILQSTQPNLDSFINSQDAEFIDGVLQELDKTQEGNLEYEVVGPGATLQDIAIVLNDWNPKKGEIPCTRLVPSESNSKSPLFNATNNNRGRAIYEDMAAITYPDDNAQSVNIIAPILTGSLGYLDAVAFLNNVWTDTNFFLQDGLLIIQYQNAMHSQVVWATTASDYYDQPFSVAYYPGNEYYFTISYTNGFWWTCVDNVNIPNNAVYRCRKEPAATGTNLQLSVNTSVWTELISEDPLWYTAFSSLSVNVTKATIYRNGVGQWWSSVNLPYSGCNNPYGTNPPYPFGGNILGGGTASFKLSDVPLQCH